MLQYGSKNIYIQSEEFDEVTSRGVICAALHEQFKLKELGKKSIVSLTKDYCTTQTVTIRLLVKTTQKLLSTRKVWIGCVVSLREQNSSKRALTTLCLDISRRHSPVALIALIDEEFVGRKSTLPRSGTINASSTTPLSLRPLAQSTSLAWSACYAIYQLLPRRTIFN